MNKINIPYFTLSGDGQKHPNYKENDSVIAFNEDTGKWETGIIRSDYRTYPDKGYFVEFTVEKKKVGSKEIITVETLFVNIDSIMESSMDLKANIKNNEFMEELSKQVCADPERVKQVRELKKWISDKRKKEKKGTS